MSLKIVGHGFVVLQPPPVVTFVTTSDSSVPVYGPGVGAPREPVNWSITRYTGDRPSRTTSAARRGGGGDRRHEARNS